jgi:DNA-directed RNA polymerase II subunit RPB2
MYEQEDDYAEEGEDSEEISNEIWQEACWIVISAYFDEKGISLLERKFFFCTEV